MFWDTFRKIGLKKRVIQPNHEPLIGFNGQASCPMGSVVLPILVANKIIHVQFTIVNADLTNKQF